MKTETAQQLRKYALLTGTLNIFSPAISQNSTDNTIKFYDMEDIVIDIHNTNDDIFEKKIDINGDGLLDFLISGINYKNEYSYIKISSASQRLENEVLIENYKYLYEEDSLEIYLVAALQQGTEIQSNENFDTYGYIMYDNGKEVLSLIKGKSNQYIGVKFKIGSTYHYGWLKIDVSEDNRTLTIKECAYNTTPNQPIAAGSQ